MSASKLLLIIGLLFNLIGALMLWRFTPPSAGKLHKGAFMVTTKTVQDAVINEPRNRKLTNIGLLILAFGFLLQLIGIVVS